jgi:hypothetical protein
MGRTKNKLPQLRKRKSSVRNAGRQAFFRVKNVVVWGNDKDHKSQIHRFHAPPARSLEKCSGHLYIDVSRVITIFSAMKC